MNPWTDDDGIVQFKVRYVGFGPDDDLWYDEDELAALSPDLVADYKEKVEANWGFGEKANGGRQEAKGLREEEGRRKEAGEKIGRAKRQVVSSLTGFISVEFDGIYFSCGVSANGFFR